MGPLAEVSDSPEHPWAFETPPTEFVCELVAVAGGGRDVIQDLTVLAGLVAVTRGPAHLDESFTPGQRRDAPTGAVDR